MLRLSIDLSIPNLLVPINIVHRHVCIGVRNKVQKHRDTRGIYSSRKSDGIPKSTSDSRFNLPFVEKLGILYEGVDNSDKIFDPLPLDVKAPEDLLIRNIDMEQLSENKFEELKGNERNIATYLRRIMKDEDNPKPREHRTDSFVNFLLMKLGFSEYPLLMNLHPDHRFRVAGKTIGSEPEFTIEREGVTVCLDEDKRFKDEGREERFGEAQIAGEILACSYTNYNNPEFDKEHQDMYAIRVIGARFTFYRATIANEYLVSLARAFPEKKEGVKILRYPSYSSDRKGKNKMALFGLNYAESKYRTEILNLLLRLREQINK